MLVQHAGSSDDFQEPSTKEKAVKSTFLTDDALEDKICDLYDLFVDVLYSELMSKKSLFVDLPF